MNAHVIGTVVMWLISMLTKQAITVTGKTPYIGNPAITWGASTVKGVVRCLETEDGSGRNWFVIVDNVELFVTL